MRWNISFKFCSKELSATGIKLSLTLSCSFGLDPEEWLVSRSMLWD